MRSNGCHLSLPYREAIENLRLGINREIFFSPSCILNGTSASHKSLGYKRENETNYIKKKYQQNVPSSLPRLIGGG